MRSKSAILDDVGLLCWKLTLCWEQDGVYIFIRVNRERITTHYDKRHLTWMIMLMGTH